MLTEKVATRRKIGTVDVLPDDSVKRGCQQYRFNMAYSSQNRRPWYLQIPLPEVAVFSCRRCHSVISKPLVALRDRLQPSEQAQTSRVPEATTILFLKAKSLKIA